MLLPYRPKSPCAHLEMSREKREDRNVYIHDSSQFIRSTRLTVVSLTVMGIPDRHVNHLLSQSLA